VGINDLGDAIERASDPFRNTVHGRFGGEVTVDADTMIVDGIASAWLRSATREAAVG